MKFVNPHHTWPEIVHFCWISVLTSALEITNGLSTTDIIIQFWTSSVGNGIANFPTKKVSLSVI